MTQATSSLAGADAPADAFSLLARSLKRIDAAAEQLEYRREDKLKELSSLILSRLACHRALFQDLLPSYNDNFRSVDPRREGLASWSVEGTDMVAEFGYVFRGQRNDFSITFPVRYMAADGEAQMAVDAAALRVVHEQAALARAEAATRQERETLAGLLEKHPDMAPVRTPVPSPAEPARATSGDAK